MFGRAWTWFIQLWVEREVGSCERSNETSDTINYCKFLNLKEVTLHTLVSQLVSQFLYGVTAPNGPQTPYYGVTAPSGPQPPYYGVTVPSRPQPPYYRGFTITLRHSTLDSTPLDE